MSSKLRMTGLISGMDTESIISALVSTRKQKVDKTKGAKTKTTWKQDAWNDINKELKVLQSSIANMRFSTSYMKKTTTVSNTNKASVITSDGATNSVQSLKIEKLAKTAYLTGGKIKDTADEPVTALSKMSDIGYAKEGTFDIKDCKGNVLKSVTVNADTTISDILSQFKSVGLNANFDADNKRFFISAKTSGAASDFSISAYDSAGNEALSSLGLDISNVGDGENNATKTDGTDASIMLNGARFTSNTNVFSVNGLTITAMGTTADDEEIVLTTRNDTSGIYDSIKNIIKTYNSVINKLDTLYNADSAKKMNPLTDEEKEAMSETEAETYEKKIKDGILSGDSTVNDIVSSLSTIMQAGIKVGEKTLYLSSFGIGTLNYFNAKDNEKHALHIDGDSDDSDTSSNSDKLMNMISTDPDTVVSFFSQLSQSLYTKMNKLSTSVNGYRSFGSFYDDKKMKMDLSDYETKISEMEEKMNAYEDKLYKQYAAMEKSMAKLQSSTNALAGMFGLQ